MMAAKMRDVSRNKRCEENRRENAMLKKIKFKNRGK